MATALHPALSVVVPVRNGAATLPACLEALAESDLPRNRWELVVVDDGSTDGSADLARSRADRVVRLPPGPHGPAHARNRGSEVARGRILVFVDADIRIHPSALRRLLGTLAEEPELTAVFGAYDTSPAAPGLVSQYRNLLHHYVHATQPGDADTFWAGIGAIRREVFQRAGGFDEAHYPRPQIEDIELGYRLRSRGHRIRLDPSIQGTHLKRWTLAALVRDDVLNRGTPWMRLLLDGRAPGPGTLNIGGGERVLTGLAIAGLALVPAGAVAGRPLVAATGGIALAAVVAGNLPLLRWFAGKRGPAFAVGIVPLRLLYYALNGVSVGLALVQRLGPGQKNREALPAARRGAHAGQRTP